MPRKSVLYYLSIICGPPSELSSRSGPIVGPCRLRLVAAHLTVFLLAFLAVYLQRIHKRLVANVRKQCW